MPRPTSRRQSAALRRAPRRCGAAPPGPSARLAPGRSSKPPSAWRSPYDTDLDRTPANYQPLTPLSFLARTASAHPDIVAIIHGKAA